MIKRIRLKASVKNNKQVAAYSKAVRSGAKIQHVVPKDKSWVVKSTSSIKATRIFNTQKEAIDYGKKVAKNNKTDVIVYGRNGKIRERTSYK